MNTSNGNERYVAFGLTISSDLQLPELIRGNVEEQFPNLIIKQETLTALWQENVQDEKYYIIRENFCLMRVPDVGLFKMENGNVISYEPLHGTSDAQIRLYLLGTCLGVVLMQRKILPLHGSCIAINGKAYAIVGDSGAGKSTLASVFIDRGYSYLTDDVIAVTLAADKNPYVTPSYPQQKLWQESLNQLGRKKHHYDPIYDRETKFAVPNSSQFWEKPLPLAGVFVLQKAEKEEVELTAIEKMERFSAVYYYTYRNFMLKRLGLLDWHFHFSASIIHALDFYLIERGHNHFTAETIGEVMLAAIHQKEESQVQTELKGVHM